MPPKVPYDNAHNTGSGCTLKYSFRPNIWMTLATLAVLALCIKLGFWQYHKAIARQAMQMQLNTRLNEPAESLSDKILSLTNGAKALESLRYKRLKLTGDYQPQYQFLLDNQVENTVAGYHVYTPLQIEGTGLYVLIDRGWVAKSAAQVGQIAKPPMIASPVGKQSVQGDISIPTAKFFTLEAKPANGSKVANQQWQPVWQNLDLSRYAQAVPFKLLPFVVRLDKNSDGGFVRNWPPPGDRVHMHLGYAYQWFGFALTLLVIFIVLNVKKVERQ
jgi:surfeit locus 1 family protein